MTKISLLGYASFALLTTGCRHTENPTSMPAIPVEVQIARTENIPDRITSIGYLESDFDAVIQPRVNGYLVGVHYNNGRAVRRGQLLFTIDPSQLSTSMLAAEAALESAHAQALEARNNYQRAIPLAQINAISQSQLDQYTAQFKASEAAVRSAEQTLRNATLEVGYTKLYAPIDGIAAYTDAHEGDYVGPGTQFSVLTTVSSIDTMTVDLSIPMTQYLRHATAANSAYDNAGLLSDIRLQLADGSKYPYAGRYDYTHKDISNQAGTITLTVRFPNPEQTLKPGQFARVEANLGAERPCVVVPQQCVSQAQGINSVWVIRPDSTAEYRKVDLGATSGTDWCIESGVAAGEKVVVAGRQKLHNGMKISPIIR